MKYMKHKIALLADVHGNASALKAVIEDSIKEAFPFLFSYFECYCLNFV